MFHILFVYLLLYTLHAEFLKKCMPEMLVVVQNWSKMVYLPQQQGPLLEISYILHFSVVTLHYHKLYQIRSRSLKDVKQPCRSYLYRIPYYPKSNNQVWFILTVMRKFWIYPHIPWNPVKAFCLMLQSLNQSTLLVMHSSIMLTTDSNCSC